MKEMRKKMQIIFQDPYSSLNPRMTVSELIAEPLVVNRVMKNKAQLRERVAELMETVGLAPRLESAYHTSWTAEGVRGSELPGPFP